ncbi:MAG TPA: hypothetical protein VIV66_01595 [Pyrinomonadaceae bacterium]
MIANLRRAERVAHLEYVPMPGGSQAIREPWRMAAVYLDRALGDEFLQLNLPFTNNLDKRAWSTLRKMAATRTNSPETCSMGRLFDAISSLVGLRTTVNYEGQAAIELEAVAAGDEAGSYSFEIVEDGAVIRAEPVVSSVVNDLLNNLPVPSISARFHEAVADLILSIAQDVRRKRGLDTVALSGGVFQNVLLVEKTRRLLLADGFAVLTHHRVPCNDGGISLGQAVIANAQLGLGRA